MIVVKRKEDCCGCSSCVQACPNKCISFKEDNAGFRYPVVDEERCIQCHICERVCPYNGSNFVTSCLNTYACKHIKDEIRLSSSSGGIFSLLAESVLKDGGVVFGARFDEKLEVVHDYVDEKNNLSLLRGSKYVQSNIGNNYLLTESFLKGGRKVLFAGTPCQIAGLKKFLKKDYSNLIAIDLVCHGVPSVKSWRKYIQSEINKNSNARKIEGVDFRSKRDGWHDYSVKLCMRKSDDSLYDIYTNHRKNDFMTLFLSDLVLRPSCYNCPFKSGYSGADITLGDFWGISKIAPEFDDDKGVSIVFVHNDKDIKFCEFNEIQRKLVSFKDSVENNMSYSHSPHRPFVPFIYNWLDTLEFTSFMRYVFLIYLFIYKCMNKVRTLKIF